MLLQPDESWHDVCDIDLDALRRQGIIGILLDLDNTLLPRDTNVVPDRMAEWVDVVKRHDMAVCFLSNNWHERVCAVARELGYPVVAKAVKPLPFAFWRALGVLGLPAERCAVVGDQLFTDVLGGNLVGCHTILVDPLSSTDLPHTLVLRRLESLIMGRSRRGRALGGERRS
ncbi:MAG: YqeG family HAD IIIA-type phosphatase [Coriobacteriales bacterium]|nr:YqeG family HAD IIIA-type phosphatase [Actinomycetes bacterium]